MLKDDENLKRIVAIAAALLVMFGIIGISVYSINHIDEINQKNREKEQGKHFAATIAQTTATTSVWDYLKSTTAPPVEETEAEPAGEESVADLAESDQTITTTIVP